MPKCFRCHLEEEKLKDPEFKRGFEEFCRKDEVAVAIAKERIRQKLSKAEVARRAGISLYQYSRMEDLDPVKPDTIAKIKAALGMEDRYNK